MNTIQRLTAIGNQEDLEAWWHPLWTQMLLPFTAAGGYLGNTANLCVAPQPALRDPVTGGFPYRYPDFAVIEAGQAGGAAFKTLHLLMEVKRPTNVGQFLQAQLECRFYITLALNPINHPPAASIYCVAAAGDWWSWREAQQAGGVWNWTAAGNAREFVVSLIANSSVDLNFRSKACWTPFAGTIMLGDDDLAQEFLATGRADLGFRDGFRSEGFQGWHDAHLHGL
ncbi:hypothetical protein B0T14DRAFT_564182 [Immersiella caudata]|uniref:Uncharacterized protein n=1 Tax=Immersiella caudata TaxID=314043 RepID=A0AA40C2M9_9PEZI|nr:hypothetical protein B0T14DRAFT_564182 [Immersiella caudata]